MFVCLLFSWVFFSSSLLIIYDYYLALVLVLLEVRTWLRVILLFTRRVCLCVVVTNYYFYLARSIYFGLFLLIWNEFGVSLFVIVIIYFCFCCSVYISVAAPQNSFVEYYSSSRCLLILLIVLFIYLWCSENEMISIRFDVIYWKALSRSQPCTL